jgi:Leucine-rich repeat (LRR) protein
MAIIIGKHIQTIPDIETKASVQTIGMEHTVTIDASGNFIMRVPAGWTRLSFQGIDPSSSLYDSMALIYGKPGEKVEFVQPITGPEDLCTDLDCDLATVRKILDSTGLYSVVPESVVIISDNRVSELHLRGKGVFRLCGSIGKLTSLRLLDIGKNKIDSIPSFAFENLYFLETVSADNNALRFLPGSIGQLKALQSLDLSSNQLQSLPEPIMYLNPSSYLNLANNYLCDIGASTVKWADRYSPGWKNMQKCVIDTQPGPNDPCSDLKCDIAVVKEILDSAYISVAPESVIVIESNSRVSELHLRSRSMKKLIPAVSRLPFLRVLDIGENYIDSLPPGLDRLYNLQELTADHNAIRTFPISVAKLKVTRLDFSYNSLPSLPDQITSLSPSFLNLQYNMLCNISESTAKWADKYDSKWRWSQKCN